MFLGQTLGEHESQVAEHIKLRTFGIVPAPSPQTVPKNLFF